VRVRLREPDPPICVGDLVARYVKTRCVTDPSHGCAPAARELAEYVRWGAVILDKPAGPTSRKAGEAVRRLVGAAKVGHGGTLDPMVTGVLPVLLGKSTRVAGLLLGSDKAYTGVMVLHGDVSDEELQEALCGFQGVIEQLPPRRSRVKRAPRRRRVHAFEATGRDGRRVEFTVRCQGGTYVRKLVHDLGQALGCGAHMVGLRRTQSGPFALEDCVTMAAIERACALSDSERDEALRRIVLPVEAVVGRLLPQVRMADGAVCSVCDGFPLAVPGVCELDEFCAGAPVAALTMKGELVGIGEALLDSGTILAERSGLAVAVHTVLMHRGTYPRWRRDDADSSHGDGGASAADV